MIMVIGRIQAKPECRDAVLRLSVEHVKRSRQEPGCIDHRVAADAEDDLNIVFVEYWADMPALKAHFALEASRNFVGALSGMLTAKPEIRIFNVDEIKPA